MINFRYFDHEDETTFFKIYFPNNIYEIVQLNFQMLFGITLE